MQLSKNRENILKNENFPRKLRYENTFVERTVSDKIGIY